MQRLLAPPYWPRSCGGRVTRQLKTARRPLPSPPSPAGPVSASWRVCRSPY